jgi:hypothetical protein
VYIPVYTTIHDLAVRLRRGRHRVAASPFLAVISIGNRGVSRRRRKGRKGRKGRKKLNKNERRVIAGI